MNEHGFVRITCASPATTVASPEANIREVLGLLARATESDVVLLPELCVTGYTCADLFGQDRLLDAAIEALGRLVADTADRRQLVVVGMPVAVGNSLFNAAVAVSEGQILGIVPKQFLANYKEFYEARWFQPARGHEPREIALGPWTSIPFGTDLLFKAGPDLVVGLEICEDLWVPIPPSSRHALAGATLLLNLSASNETIGKPAYRRQLVVGQSGRTISAYAYASSGPGESTTDLVFGGHCLIAENGVLLGESRRVGDGGNTRIGSHLLTRDVDVQKLRHDRRGTPSFEAQPHNGPPYRRLPFRVEPAMKGLERFVAANPFVPDESAELEDRCAEIFGIQCAGLAKRLEQLPPAMPLNIGVSGGLDSTLSLLVTARTCDLLGRDRSLVHGLTMPGFGTTARTRTNALDLMRHLGTSSDEVDISSLALQTFRDLDHHPFDIDPRAHDLAGFRKALSTVPRERRQDLVFENVQARLRTFLLMSRGFVVGTGDLSELALGWCTYNGDHMSMYNPNVSIPKTLVKFLVEYVALKEFEAGPVRDTLLSIASTTISPELLPTAGTGENEQSTEAVLGPYELHDFYLYQSVRNGFAPEKILFLSDHARFTAEYSRPQRTRVLRTFYERFFRNQFKRSCLPDGPKVGSVSLSPRGDWRMPSDADPSAWLSRLTD